jgi:hypothetical protein
VSSPELDLILTEFQSGKIAFEQGRYRQSVRHLETARDRVEMTSRLGGEVQLWLATAYDAAGDRQDAIALCRSLKFHPSWDTRKQSRRLLEILEAPKLSRDSEGLVQIPDLSDIDADGKNFAGARARSGGASTSRSENKRPAEEPLDLSQVNTKDNQFLWVALVALGLTVGSLFLFASG